MIQIKIIPDGTERLPIEAKDHRIQADKLRGVDLTDESAPSWNDITREIHRDYIYLQIKGDLDNYSDKSLDEYVGAFTSIDGIKAHPEGWQEIATDT